MLQIILMNVVYLHAFNVLGEKTSSLMVVHLLRHYQLFKAGSFLSENLLVSASCNEECY